MKICHLFVSLFFYSILQAQSFSGFVTSQNGQPVANATLLLMRAMDTSLLKTGISDSLGKFSFTHLDKKKYFLKLSSLSFKDTLISVDIGKQSVITISLAYADSLTRLPDVVISTTRNRLIEVKIDRIIFDPSSLVASAGSNAYEVVQKAPAISADQEGNILLRGISGVGIMVNGRILQMSPDQIMNYLKSIPADQVSKVEILTNPSSKYEAEGTAGLINIILKKNKLYGLNGTITPFIEQNKGVNVGNSLSINYKAKKVDFSLGSNIAGGKSYSLEQVDNIYSRDTDPYYYYENGNRARTQTSTFSRLNLDYSVNDNNKIGISFENSSNSRKGTEANMATFSSRNIKNNYDSTYESIISLHNLSNTFTSNINYVATLDSNGQELSVNFDYLNYHQPELSTSVQTNRFNEASAMIYPSILFTNVSAQTINIYAIKVDYSKSLNDKIFFEAGAKYNQNITSSDYNFYNVSSNIISLDSAKSDRFNYKEQNLSAYSNLSAQLTKKISSQLGIRAEKTLISESSNSNKFYLLEQNYVRIFPTIFLQYNANNNNQFVISYTKRINRPGFSSLNPFKYYSTPNSFIQGNPFLQPSFSNSIDFTYTLKQKFYFNFFAHLTDHSITQAPILSDSSFSYIYDYINVDYAYNYGFFAYIPVQVFKFWQSQFSTTISFNGVKDNSVFSNTYKYQNINYQFQVNNKFSFKSVPGFAAEVNFRYQPSGMAQGLFMLGRMADLSVGLKQSFRDKRSTISVNLLDLLNTSYVTAKVDTYNQYSYTHGNYYKRGVRIAFTYLFGKMTVKNKELKPSSIQEESQRVK
jgi:outer membrane receptor protein involved in Fe transport